MALPEEPISRIEQYLSNMAGEGTPLPEPVSRIEQYLEYLAVHGGSGGGAKAEIGWNGQSVPDVTKIPAGVTVRYGEVEYVGTLAASAETAKYIILVYSGGEAPNVYDEYHTVLDGSTYTWEAYGQKIDLSNYYTKSEADAKFVTTFPYASLVRRDTYLYDVSYISIPPDANVDMAPGGACSSFVRDGKLYRNMDWDYDELATFHMHCPGFEGCAFLPGLTSTAIDEALIGQLPYHVCDGRNDYGIMLATHVLFNDWGATGSGEIPLTKLPYLVLSRVKSMATLEADLAGVLDNLYVPSAMAASEYLIQVIVTDGVTTCVIRPGDSEAATYEIVDATVNPKLTNFLWVADEIVERANLQTRPTGVERWNMIGNNVSLSDLRFTKAYEEATRLSEFIGIDGTTKDSTDAELEAIYELAHTAYLTRTRDGTTWQTMHSAVYGSSGLEHLWIQEDWDKDYIASGAEWGKIGGSLADQADLAAALGGKVPVAQGVAHAGDFMVVGSDGNITTQAFSVLEGGSY